MFLIGGLIFGSIGTVFALTYRASDITYTPTDNTWNVTTVGQAINDLALSKTSDNYSTDEQVVGTWIDGKPIYQKTITGTIPSADKGVNELVTMNNISELINVIGVVHYSNQNVVLPGMSGDIILMNGKIYSVLSSNTFVGSTIKVTIQYTKTTDTVSN